MTVGIIILVICVAVLFTWNISLQTKIDEMEITQSYTTWRVDWLSKNIKGYFDDVIDILTKEKPEESNNAEH